MFEFLARHAYHKRWWFVAAGVAVFAIGIVYGGGVFSKLKDGGLNDPASESFREEALNDPLFPDSRVSMIVMLSSTTSTADQPEFKQTATAFQNEIGRDPSTQSTMGYYDTKDAHFVSRDRHSVFALVSLKDGGDQQTAAYERMKKLAPGGGLSVTFGGPVVADDEINQEVQRDIPRAERVSLPILALLLVLIFRSVIAAALPLVIGGVCILGAFSLTRLIASFTDVSIFSANIISLLGLGLAIDYSLLFVNRFRDEMAAGQPIQTALSCTLRTAGESVFFSGMTVSVSLLGLLVFPENFLRSMGLGGALAAVVAMTASLTILPAALAILGPWVNKLALPIPQAKYNGHEAQQDFWRAFGRWSVRRAGTITLIGLTLLLALGIPFLHVRFANTGSNSLPEYFQSRITDETLNSDFANSQSEPLQVLIRTPDSPLDPGHLTNMVDYVGRLKKIPGVGDIGSLVTLTGKMSANDYQIFYDFSGGADAAKAAKHFVSGNYTLLQVGYHGDSQSESAQKLVRWVRDLEPPMGAKVMVGGETADLVDHISSLAIHVPIAAALILLATFLALFSMLRSIAIPATALVLNTLSLCASFGVMTLIFQQGYLSDVLQFTSSHSLDPTLPVLIFAIAFGLATDYEVFLVSRIKEEYYRTGDNDQAIVTGVEKTGQIVTSAALLLIVVVAAFGASKILMMKEMGVGLCIAVAIDAAIVRTLLVPATMQLFGKANWWLPKAIATARELKRAA